MPNPDLPVDDTLLPEQPNVTVDIVPELDLQELQIVDPLGQTSEPCTFTVVEALVPVITSVRDSRGVEIPKNTFTVDANITVSGTATPNLKVEVYRNEVETGDRALVNASGHWSRNLIGLAPGIFSLTAVARYGSAPVSAPWQVSVTESVAPVIVTISDSKSGEIPHGGVTVDTRVIITGTASKGQKVEVFDGITSQGQTSANPVSGVFTLEISELSPTVHSFSLKGLYGAAPVTGERTLTVVTPVVPVITLLIDRHGIEVADGDTIVNTWIDLVGTGSAGLEVEIFVGLVSMGKVAVNARGGWEYRVSGLQSVAHSLTAQATYDRNLVSAPRHIIVAHALVPVITTLKDFKGVDVPKNSTTVDTRVTLTGSGTANLEVEVFDGATSKGVCPVNEKGVWVCTVTDLAIEAHSFKAKAKYGSFTQSLPWDFAVTALLTPVINSVKDSKGVEIPRNGLTVDDHVMVRGTATPNLQIEIFNNGITTGGKATADPQGYWERGLFYLVPGDWNLTVVARYGSAPESVPWKIIVTQNVAPTITQIKDSDDLDITHGGITTSTHVTITGMASKGQRVDVLDGNVSKGQATADPVTGVWTLEVIGLSATAHVFKATALYGD